MNKDYKNQLLNRNELDELMANTGVSAPVRPHWSGRLLLALHIPLLLVFLDLLTLVY